MSGVTAAGERTAEAAAAQAVGLAERIEVASSFGRRLRGLIGRTLGEGEGLYLTPCTGVHMFGMKEPIDVVFLDREGRALDLYHGLRPWRVSRMVPNAHGALELPAGTLARSGLKEGDRVALPEGALDAPAGSLTGLASNLILGAFWLYLAVRMLPLLLQGQGSPSAWMLFAVNSLVAFLFFFRRKERRLTESSLDRLITLACILMSFSLRPAPGAGLLPEGATSVLLTVSLLLVFGSYLSLGRSFGLIPADRGIKSGGLYAFVRHPLYGAEMLFFASFLLANFSLRNLSFFAGILLSLHLRALAEERLLAQDEVYREYCRRVTARYLPGLV